MFALPSAIALARSKVNPMTMPEVSAVIPCYNEQENAANIIQAVIDQLEPICESFDVILIDNASTDDTVAIIKKICEKDKRVRLIANTRNFGQMRSPTHGIFVARGRAVIGLCADFQDPPEMIPIFVDRWRAGIDIVLGVRKSERAGLITTLFRNVSYWFAQRFGDYPLVPNATGFGLYDQKVVREIAAMHEPEPFFRGMLVETGYSLETILYDRPLRARGVSSNNFFVLLDFALSSLASFSKKIVRLPFFIGVGFCGFAGLTVIFAIVAAVMGSSAGIWLIAALFQMQFGLLFIFLGILGDQVRLISERTRRTPLVVERERINFPDDY